MKNVIEAIRTALFCLLTAAAGAAFAAEGGAPTRVMEPGELTLERYTVIERLWVGTLRSLFWTTTYDTPDAAIAALSSEAVSLGANAVTHLSCFRDGGAWYSPGGYFCTALAIKLK